MVVLFLKLVEKSILFLLMTVSLLAIYTSLFEKCLLKFFLHFKIRFKKKRSFAIKFLDIIMLYFVIDVYQIYNLQISSPSN